MLPDSGMSEYGNIKAEVARVASRAWGRISWSQLLALGVPDSTISEWLDQGYLHRRLPRVYAVGHVAAGTEAPFTEALLYAGPGAMLSHATAAWWLGLIDDQPRGIHISTPRQVKSLRGIRIH